MKMNFLKCKTRTQLTDGHLDGVLRLTGTSLQPDVGHLVAQQHHQHQVSVSHGSTSQAPGVSVTWVNMASVASQKHVAE